MKLIPMAAAAALSLAAGASLAQPGPPPGAGPQGAEHHWQKPDPAQMAERHAQRLRDALQLRPDQEPALQQLVAAMKPPAGAMDHEHDGHEAMSGLPTPQRLDRMQAEMAEHQARFQTHAAAVKRFYAQLTPAQQKAFDAMPMMGHEHGHEHGPPGMRGGPGMMRNGPGAPGGPGAPPPPASE